MKLFIFLSLFLPSISFAGGVVGFWKGESFSIELVGSRISGYWGKKSYDIQIYGYGFAGAIDNKEVKIDHWTHDITGKLPCGDVDIKSWSTDVEGVICGESFATTTGDQKNSNDVAGETADSAFLSEFPAPALGSIRNHIKWFRNKLAH